MWHGRCDSAVVHFLLTFDYEIAFGPAQAPEQAILFEPAQALLTLLSDLGVPGTFFADTLSLDGYASRGGDGDAYGQNFRRQLRSARAAGHDVQTHLHPHWIGARWDGSTRQWQFEFRHYAFGGLARAHALDAATTALRRAHELTADIRGSAPVAFRAGGYSTLPLPEAYLQALVDMGYRYDSSVNPYRRQQGAVHAYDYLQVPDRSSWQIAPATGFAQAASGGPLTEIPLANLPRSGLLALEYQWQRIWKQRNPAARRIRRQLDTLVKAVGARDESAQSVDQAIGLSFDMTTVYDVPRMLWHTERYLSRHRDESTTYVCLIAHPKSLYAPCLDALARYVRAARDRWPQARWTTFEQLATM